MPGLGFILTAIGLALKGWGIVKRFIGRNTEKLLSKARSGRLKAENRADKAEADLRAEKKRQEHLRNEEKIKQSDNPEEEHEKWLSDV